MDESALRQLARDGLSSAPATRDLEAWCWERADATGDARFCGFARSLEQIAYVWDEYKALPDRVVKDINSALQRHLPAALRVPTAEEGAGLARLLREDVSRILQEWDGRF